MPKLIENELEMETEIHQNLAVEKFRNEIDLLQSRSQRYEQRFQNLDSEMVAYISSKFSEDISTALTKQWEKSCKKEEGISIEISREKEDWIREKAVSGFRQENRGNRLRDNRQQNRIGGNRNSGESNSNNQGTVNSREERRPFFGEYRRRSLSRNRGQQRGRGYGWNRSQNRGRQQNRGTTPRGNGYRGRFRARPQESLHANRNQTVIALPRSETTDRRLGNARNQADVRLLPRNETVDRNQPNSGQDEALIVPETQQDQLVGGQNGGNINSDIQRGEGNNNNFLFHAQGSTNSNPSSNRQ